MANSDKNIVITPNIGSSSQPQIAFTGLAATTITLKVLDDSYGTLSWEGGAGQLFSINNNLTSGSIFSVNDVSGIPSIDVNANGTVSLGAYGGNIGIGTTSATSKLQVRGNVLVSGIATATTFSGALANTLTLNTSGTGLSGSTTFNNSGAATFTVTSNATSANTVSTIVARDASGNFSAGTITATLSGTATNLSGGSVAATTGTFSNYLRTLEQVRATGWYGTPTGSSYTGLAVEMGMSAGQGYVICYNRDTSAYGALNISNGSATIQFPSTGSTINVTGAISGNSTITGTQLISSIATGTAPLSVTSTTQVNNLNVQYLAGQQGSYYLNTDTTSQSKTGQLWASYGNTNMGGYSWVNAAFTTNSIEIVNNNGTVTTSSPTLAFHRYGTGGPQFRLDATGTNVLYLESANAGTARTSISPGSTYFSSLSLTSSDANGIYINSNKVWHLGNDGTGSGLDADLLDGVDSTTYSSSLRANRIITGGGTITVDASYNVLWSNRFLVISNGYGSNFSTNGYFDISCPLSGTITGVGGASNVTATSSGIPLGNWTAIYYILPIGSTNTSLAANFRVVSYTSALDIPHNWVLICVRNNDDGTITFNNGIVLGANQSMSSVQQSTANTANTLVKRDASGNFSAGTITASLTGNVSGSSGSCTGNAATATTATNQSGGTVSATTGSFSGQLQTASPSTYSGITSIAIGNNYPIYTPEVNTGGGGFTPFIVQRTLVTAGYRQVLSLGSYRAGGDYTGGVYIAPGGGSDTNPTDYFLFSYQGALSYSGSAITFPKQIQSTQANSTTTGGGQIYLNGATGNRIDFNGNGIAAPTTTTRSAGTKLVLYPSLDASNVDYAFGMESSTLWSSVSSSGAQFKWYAATTNIATLSGTGNLSITGIATATQLDLTASATANDSVLYLSGAPSGPSSSNGLFGIGTLNFTDSDIIANFKHNVNSYAQLVVQNTNSGSTASADIIVNNDRSAGTTYYGDFGINATTFAGGGPFQDPDGTYLYASGGTLAVGTNDAKDFRIATGSATATPVTRMTITGIGGSVGIGTTNPSQPLHVQGNARVTGAVYDSTNSPGTSGQVLQSTVSGTQWTTAATGGGSGKFDTTIDNVLYIQPTGELAIVGVGTTTTQITTLPAGSNKYLIHSLHVTNVSNGDAEISAGFIINANKVPASISVSAGFSGGAGIHTFTVGSASSITVGMAVTGTGNIGETTGIGSTAGFQYNTYVTSVDGNNITLSKPMSGYATGVLYFSPVSKVASRLPVPVGSAVELMKQPMILNVLDSIVLQSTGAGSGIGSTSTAAISQTANSNTLTVTAGAAITNFIAAGQLIQGTGSNTGIQTNTFVGVGYIPGSLSIPMTRPATSTLASQVLSFTEVVVPEDGALQVTVVYQSSTDTSYLNGTGTVVGIVTLASQASSSLLGITSTTPSVYYATGTTYPSIIQSIRVTNISDGAIYPGGDYPVSVGIGNSDTVFSWLAYNMVIPKNSSIELCEAPKRIGIGQSIFASSPIPGVIEIQVAGKQKTS